MFQPRFESPIVALIKRHTIRPQRKRPVQLGAALSLRVWTGKPYRSPQREFMRATVSRVDDVTIFRDRVEVITPLKVKTYTALAALDCFAQCDGFRDWNEMRDWFETNHGLEQPFEGVLIGWEGGAA